FSSSGLSLLFFLMVRPPPRSTLFPYTTLFRSGDQAILSPVEHQRWAGDRAQSLVRGPALHGLPLPPSGAGRLRAPAADQDVLRQDRKSTRLNSSHVSISYAVFCLKKKKIYYNLLAPHQLYIHLFSKAILKFHSRISRILVHLHFFILVHL